MVLMMIIIAKVYIKKDRKEYRYITILLGDNKANNKIIKIEETKNVT